MRTKLLRGRDEVTVQFVYPSTLDEYRQALDAFGGSLPAAGNGDSPLAGCRPGHAAYVVTTAQQRHLWDLPDLTVSGGVVPVDEPRALDLLHGAAAESDRAAGLAVPVGETGRCLDTANHSWDSRHVHSRSLPRKLLAFGALAPISSLFRQRPPVDADHRDRIDRACSALDASSYGRERGWAAWACFLLLDSPPPVGDGGCTGQSAG